MLLLLPCALVLLFSCHIELQILEDISLYVHVGCCSLSVTLNFYVQTSKTAEVLNFIKSKL